MTDRATYTYARWSTAARSATVTAAAAAASRGVARARGVDALVGILLEEGSAGVAAFDPAPEAVEAAAILALGPERPRVANAGLSPELVAVHRRASDVADHAGEWTVSTAALLYALVEQDPATARVLRDTGIVSERLLEQLWERMTAGAAELDPDPAAWVTVDRRETFPSDASLLWRLTATLEGDRDVYPTGFLAELGVERGPASGLGQRQYRKFWLPRPLRTVVEVVEFEEGRLQRTVSVRPSEESGVTIEVTPVADGAALRVVSSQLVVSGNRLLLGSVDRLGRAHLEWYFGRVRELLAAGWPDRSVTASAPITWAVEPRAF